MYVASALLLHPMFPQILWAIGKMSWIEGSLLPCPMHGKPERYQSIGRWWNNQWSARAHFISDKRKKERKKSKWSWWGSSLHLLWEICKHLRNQWDPNPPPLSTSRDPLINIDWDVLMVFCVFFVFAQSPKVMATVIISQVSAPYRHGLVGPAYAVVSGCWFCIFSHHSVSVYMALNYTFKSATQWWPGSLQNMHEELPHHLSSSPLERYDGRWQHCLQAGSGGCPVCLLWPHMEAKEHDDVAVDLPASSAQCILNMSCVISWLPRPCPPQQIAAVLCHDQVISCCHGWLAAKWWPV